MEATSMNIGPANILFEVVHAMRLELTFLVFFGCLYLMNKYFFSKAKPSPPKSSKARMAAMPSGEGPKVSGKAADSTASRRRTAPGPSTSIPTSDSAEARIFTEPAHEFRHPRPEQLRDEEWFARAALTLKSVQVQRAVEVYKAALRVGLDLSKLPPSKGEEVFVALVTAAIRANQPLEALDILKNCRSCGFKIGLGLAASATKLCTSKQYYKECLLIYDFIRQDESLVLDERSIWSCLLFCAVEARAYTRCPGFWKQMQACGTPYNKDYGNMIRYASNQREWQLTLTLIAEMRERGVEVDNVVYNMALATCVTCGKTDEARLLLKEMEASEGVVDVITYNTLAKGYAKGGKMAECFQLYEHMRERGMAPSQVTYGILLDCCINENHMDRAVEVFNHMTEEGCVMNTVLYTTLIKGFARAGQVDQAMSVYEKMLEDRTQGVTPDLITFSILIKANCDAGGLKEALKLLDTMLDLNLHPDEVVFNNLLSGCVQKNDEKLGKQLFKNMIEAGLKPSNATFSIMLRLLASCKLLEEALELLRSEPQKFSVAPEARLFVQLAQACLRERQGRTAVEVYSLMLERSNPTASMTGGLLSMCSKLNMLGSGVEILDIAVKAPAKLDTRDVQELRQAAVRKKKTEFVDQIDQCLRVLSHGRQAA
mmetsp:Transcript_28008/g.60798  ORF Transcript_28008/g.60798 Transcript_28008/m.60798 type:complete len:656 (+) Transcript_28008:161-2128(+)